MGPTRSPSGCAGPRHGVLGCGDDRPLRRSARASGGHDGRRAGHHIAASGHDGAGQRLPASSCAGQGAGLPRPDIGRAPGDRHRSGMDGVGLRTGRHRLRPSGSAHRAARRGSDGAGGLLRRGPFRLRGRPLQDRRTRLAAQARAEAPPSAADGWRGFQDAGTGGPPGRHRRSQPPASTRERSTSTPGPRPPPRPPTTSSPSFGTPPASASALSNCRPACIWA